MKRAVNKFFSSGIAGVLAALLVMVGTFIFVGANKTDDRENWGPGFENSILIVILIIPAFIGLITSLLVRIQDKTLNRIVGVVQCLLGAGFILALQVQLNVTLPGDNGFIISRFCILALAASGVIFILSGLYAIFSNPQPD